MVSLIMCAKSWGDQPLGFSDLLFFPGLLFIISLSLPGSLAFNLLFLTKKLFQREAYYGKF
jgi:hypothetical protein